MDKSTARKLHMMSLMAAASGPLLPTGPTTSLEIRLPEGYDTDAKLGLSLSRTALTAAMTPNPRKVTAKMHGHKPHKDHVMVRPKAAASIEGVSRWIPAVYEDDDCTEDGYWLADKRFDDLGPTPDVVVEVHVKTGIIRRILVNGMLYPDDCHLTWADGKKGYYGKGDRIPTKEFKS